MRYISFAWTEKPFIANAKDMTRRYWKDTYAKRFDVMPVFMKALNKLPFVNGSKQIGEIMMYNIFQQKTGEMTETDYIREGLFWMEENNLLINDKHPRDFFEEWKENNDLVWVIEFKKVRDENHKWLSAIWYPKYSKMKIIK